MSRVHTKLLPAIAAMSMFSLTQHVAAQDIQPDGSVGPGTTGGAPPALNVPRGNPLEGLFTPQPQFPTAQTLMNPQPPAPAPGELNPLKGLFTPQPQYLTPQATRNPQPQLPEGEVNHLKGVFTPPNQYATPHTLLNPQPVPRNFIPERQYLFGSDADRYSIWMQHNYNTFGTPFPPSPASAQTPTAKNKTAPTKPEAKKKPVKTPSTKASPTAQAEAAAAAAARNAMRQALESMHAGDNKKALDLLEHVVADRPGDAQARYLRAVALVNLKRYPEAQTEYSKVIEMSHDDQLTALARAGLHKISQP